MKVILVNGSPHEDGCTNYALNEMQKVFNEEGLETEIFWIGNKQMGGCLGCCKCRELKKCVIDDIVNVFIKKCETADAFVFGSPVHYAAAASNLTAFMDRVFYAITNSGQDELLRHKPATAIISARRAGTTTAFDQLNKYFSIKEMPIITSNYWNMVHGNNKDEVIKDLEGIQTIRILARNMSFYLKCLEAGKEKGIIPPEKEKKISTNFIN